MNDLLGRIGPGIQAGLYGLQDLGPGKAQLLQPGDHFQDRGFDQGGLEV